MSHGQHLPSPAPTPFPGAPPDDPTIRATLEKELQRLAQDLYEMEVCAGEVVAGMEGQVAERLEKVNRALVELTRLAPQVTDSVPKQVIENVDKARNPHQYTKTSLSRATGENQYALGRLLGLESFRRQLESGLSDAFPDLPLPERRHKPVGVENGEGGFGDGAGTDGEGSRGGAGEKREAGTRGGSEAVSSKLEEGDGESRGLEDGSGAGRPGEGQGAAAAQRAESEVKTEDLAGVSFGTETDVAIGEDGFAGRREMDTRAGAELGESDANGDSKPAV
ncbi:hypothetical protein CC85DRAFT_147035 [Cutaneotrichosporon oleaginosum]|uniref:Mediator of RNA polymerase II transcription subunit 10 n=1 Tax=Cutaneotrichosporon oleaginosum TaxID=879819 RepID=A0A0J0XHI9_9TREE|nr:uncharacterized protein CC85DRAFT_147035 [Cutaneotrichosporon oleaginosum]KLT40595.1 hypothetical protein CC85DRAFT_147035 [Cutaneotrichosporon oleaginosum]TXT03920.1 hypothetical protein COLE_07617 [Cutaneotrichosporon oleaginosum]